MPPIQCVSEVLSLGLNLQRLEANYSPESYAEVKERVELYVHSPNMPSWRGAHLKHRDIFFTFTLSSSPSLLSSESSFFP